MFTSSIKNSRSSVFLAYIELEVFKSFTKERNSKNHAAVPHWCVLELRNVHITRQMFEEKKRFFEKTKEVERNLFTVPEPTENGLFLVRCQLCYLQRHKNANERNNGGKKKKTWRFLRTQFIRNTNLSHFYQPHTVCRVRVLTESKFTIISWSDKKYTKILANWHQTENKPQVSSELDHLNCMSRLARYLMLSINPAILY